MALVAVVAGVALSLSGCAPGIEGAAPGCDSATRLAIVAQSVPGAAYVPCVRDLPAGWRAASFNVQNGSTRFSLVSDRAPESPVRVALLAACDVRGATPTTPRADGARTFLQVDTIDPRFSGTLFDVFPGGCVTYRFNFPRGTHISLTEDFESAVGLMSRRELRLHVDHQLGVKLDP